MSPLGGWSGVGCLEDGGGGYPPFQFHLVKVMKEQGLGGTLSPGHLFGGRGVAVMVDWFASAIADILELDDVLLLLC